MIIQKPTDILAFGKNRGLSLSKVYQYQPSYIEWAILTVEGFCIDLESFENLDYPTTIKYDSQAFNPERLLRLRNLEFNVENLSEFLDGNDSINSLISVQNIIDDLKSDPASIQILENFRFPEHIRAINCYKILQSFGE